MPNNYIHLICWFPQFFAQVIKMEEILCNVELVKDNNDFVARIQSDLGGMREYKSSSFEEVLEQLMIDLQEEFESI